MMKVKYMMGTMALVAMTAGAISGCSSASSGQAVQTVGNVTSSTAKEETTPEGTTPEMTTTEMSEEPTVSPYRDWVAGYYYRAKNTATGEEKKLVVTDYWDPVIMIMSDDIVISEDVHEGDPVRLNFDSDKTDYNEGPWTDGFHDIAEGELEIEDWSYVAEVRDKFPWLEAQGWEGNWPKLIATDTIIPHPQYCTADMDDERRFHINESVDSPFAHCEIVTYTAGEHPVDTNSYVKYVDQPGYTIWLAKMYQSGDKDPYGLTVGALEAEYILYIENKLDEIQHLEMAGLSDASCSTINDEVKTTRFTGTIGVDVPAKGSAFSFLYVHSTEEIGAIKSFQVFYFVEPGAGAIAAYDNRLNIY